MNGNRYSVTAISLHWVMAVLVLAQFTLGWWMIGIPKDPPGVRADWFNLHKSIGLTAGMLVLVRLGWRLRRPAPPLPSTLPRWQALAARANHTLLYACMLVMPLTGYLGSSFTKYPVKYFGITLPRWGWDAPALKDLFSAIHYATVWLFMILVALHIAAALKHLLLDRDGVFERMWLHR